MELTAYECNLGAQHLDSQVREFQFAHFFSGSLIGLLVAVEGGLPTLRFAGAGEKCQVGRIPISGHERFEIALVPGSLLFVDHLTDLFGSSRRSGRTQNSNN